MASSYLSDFIEGLDELRKLRTKNHLVFIFETRTKKGENLRLKALSAYLCLPENRRTRKYKHHKGKQ